MEKLPALGSKVLVIGTTEPIMKVESYSIPQLNPEFETPTKVRCSWEIEGITHEAWLDPSSLEVILT